MLVASDWMSNLLTANFQKNKFVVFGFLVVFVLVSIAVAPIILASISDSLKPNSIDNNADLGEKDFPLEINLVKTNYNVGEKIAFNATITNGSGKDVDLLSNGHQPWATFRNINENTTFGETSEGVCQVFRAEEKIAKTYEFEANKSGTYILSVHYLISVNNVWFNKQLSDITIEVK